jgi:hypothetical protein
LAVVIAVGYFYYLFFALPAKNERKRQAAIETLQMPNIHEMVTKTMEWYHINKPTETPMPTLTPTITLTPTPTQKTYPTITMTPESSTVMRAHISYYWPPLCGTAADPNCINGDHNIYDTAEGSDWVARALEGEKMCACPEPYPFGTRFKVFDDVWTCYDRGGAIVWTAHNEFWIDLLWPEMPYPIEWGTTLLVEVMNPLD